MEKPGLSLIVSFYNRLDALEMVLASLELQLYKRFEVIIADDGSSDKVVRKLEGIISESPLEIRHVHHEDRGWRKNIILNKAVVESKSDYLMFIDGDCILHPSCLMEHTDHREPGWVIAGRRVNLSEGMTAKLNPEKIRRGDLWGRLGPRMLMEGLFKQSGHSENSIYLTSRWIRKAINKRDKGILGSHFSLFREDVLDVNGFDERYLSPAVGEDTDLEMRLRKNGVRIRTLKHIAIQYHLYHKELERDRESLKILEETVNNGMVFTPYGINKKT